MQPSYYVIEALILRRSTETYRNSYRNEVVASARTRENAEETFCTLSKQGVKVVDVVPVYEGVIA